MPLPAAVRELAAARQVRLAWENADALTFEVDDGPDRRFVKWAPAGSPLDLTAEVARMTWAVAYTPVPGVLGLDADSEGSWLVTAALPGRNAVSRRWLADPRTAVIAIGEGLRAMHDALPVNRLPVLLDGTGSDRRRTASGRGRAPRHLGLGSGTPRTRHRECGRPGPEHPKCPLSRLVTVRHRSPL
jgi:aminoglycoside phosphotransferase